MVKKIMVILFGFVTYTHNQHIFFPPASFPSSKVFHFVMFLTEELVTALFQTFFWCFTSGLWSPALLDSSCRQPASFSVPLREGESVFLPLSFTFFNLSLTNLSSCLNRLTSSLFSYFSLFLIVLILNELQFKCTKIRILQN